MSGDEGAVVDGPDVALTEAEREALEGLAQALSCSQCGQAFSERACGLVHVMVQADPRQHRLIAPLLAAAVAREREAREAAESVADSMQHFADVAERVERRNNELAGQVAAVRALADEHKRLVTPAPYTSERALIERLEALVDSSTVRCECCAGVCACGGKRLAVSDESGGR